MTAASSGCVTHYSDRLIGGKHCVMVYDTTVQNFLLTNASPNNPTVPGCLRERNPRTGIPSSCSWWLTQLSSPVRVCACVCVFHARHEVHMLNEFELLHSSHSGSEPGWRRGSACLWILVLNTNLFGTIGLYLIMSPISCFSYKASQWDI